MPSRTSYSSGYRTTTTDSNQSRAHPCTEQNFTLGYELFVTVPVLFELASHITHVRDGNRRRTLGKKLFEDITKSFDKNEPWTIVTVGSDILLRSEDVLRLAERFLDSSGPNYSFADISIIDLAAVLRRRKRTVTILAFEGQLESYSD